MKKHSHCKTVLMLDNSDDVFKHLINTLQNTISGWDYLVDWRKTVKNKEDVEIHLNILNSLIGKDNIEQEAEKILTKYPEIIPTLPILLAKTYKKNEAKKISILLDQKQLTHKTYNFSDTTDSKSAIEFMKNTGLLNLIKDKKFNSLVDYVFGIEVGLDSNARKNRSGKQMEAILENHIKKICNQNKWKYLPQATQKILKENWTVDIQVEKTNTRFDFAVKTPQNTFLIETNFYGGGGSKLKSTAKEYRQIHKSYGHPFIWVTDGKGWKTARNALKEAFDELDYVINLNMVQQGILENILKSKA